MSNIRQIGLGILHLTLYNLLDYERPEFDGQIDVYFREDNPMLMVTSKLGGYGGLTYFPLENNRRLIIPPDDVKKEYCGHIEGRLNAANYLDLRYVNGEYARYRDGKPDSGGVYISNAHVKLWKETFGELPVHEIEVLKILRQM